MSAEKPVSEIFAKKANALPQEFAILRRSISSASLRSTKQADIHL
jgi:hypothetical protein